MRELHGTDPQRRGGATTKQRYGHEHYVEIGAKGGEVVRNKRGKDFFVEIGRRGGKSSKRQSDVPQGSEAMEAEEQEFEESW
jgi:general stress protein YciG